VNEDNINDVMSKLYVGYLLQSQNNHKAMLIKRNGNNSKKWISHGYKRMFNINKSKENKDSLKLTIEQRLYFFKKGVLDESMSKRI
jgi:hypothetical protein